MFSIIIPVKNDPRIFSCLDSIYGQSLPRDKYEVIVIEDGGQSLLKQLDKYPNLIYRSIPQSGSFAARNLGIKLARNEICAFIDADCTADTDWLEKASHHFESNKNQVVGGEIRLQTRIKMNGVEFFESLFYLNQEDYQIKYGFFATANFFCPREIFLKYGSFKGIAIAEEEREFCSRVSSIGIGLIFSREAIVKHPAQSELLPFVRRIFRDSLCQLKFKSKLYVKRLSLVRQKVRTIRFYCSRIWRYEGKLFLRLQASNIVILVTLLNLLVLVISPLINKDRSVDDQNNTAT